VPVGLARAILRAPGARLLARAPLALLESVGHVAVYNPRGTLELLRGSGLHCPPFESYVDNLVRFVRETHAERRARLEEEVLDPFDG
jgi:hypothetical protein